MLDKFERETIGIERKELHCAECTRITIHNLEARCIGTWNDSRANENGGLRYAIFRCGACDAVCYETVSWNTLEVEYDEDGDPYCPETAVQYPAPVSAHFNFNLESTPPQLDSILDEMLYALAGSKMVLATIGLRLAIEFILNDRKSVGRSLANKIDYFYSQKIIDDDQRDLLHNIRQRGNAGAHEAQGMSAKELVAGMSIIAGLLEKLYNGPARHADTMKRARRLLKADEAKP